jgi:8-oxo-dGTP diphosphatase
LTLRKVTDYEHPPGRRIGSLALIRNTRDDVLMVKPTNEEGWILPGGCAHADEHAYEACVRRVREEVGLPVTPGRLLVVDYIPHDPEAKVPEAYDFVYDCGQAPDGVAITLGATAELSSWGFIPVHKLHDYALPEEEGRVRAAMAAREYRVLTYLVKGRQVGEARR